MASGENCSIKLYSLEWQALKCASFRPKIIGDLKSKFSNRKIYTTGLHKHQVCKIILQYGLDVY